MQTIFYHVIFSPNLISGLFLNYSWCEELPQLDETCRHFEIGTADATQMQMSRLHLLALRIGGMHFKSG